MVQQRTTSSSGSGGAWTRHRVFAILAAIVAAVLTFVSVPTAAFAAPNQGIAVGQVVIGEGTGTDGQLVVGDKVSVTGTWDASKADPKPGDSFTIGLPPELKIPEDLPFPLIGPDSQGNSVT